VAEIQRDVKMNSSLREKVKNFPDSPGVYIMKSKTKEILYVGKATSLKDRVSSYFLKAKTDQKIEKLIESVDDIEFIITKSPYEALILECNFIKKYKPYFNIQLKDSKSYAYIKITNDDYPAILKVRRILDDGALYFGPYTSAKALSKILKLLSKTFCIRVCKGNLANKREKRACLLMHINQCLAPCVGKVDIKTYSDAVNNAVMFLKGEYKPLKKHLEAKMNYYSGEENFEYASILRDQIFSIDSIIDKQRVVSPSLKLSQDIFAIYTEESQSLIEIMKVREGKIIYEDNFTVESTLSETPQSVLTSFLSRYYLDINKEAPPTEIILSLKLNESDKESLLKAILEKYNLKNIKFIYPTRGEKKKALELCLENAKKHFEIKIKSNRIVPKNEPPKVLFDIKELLSLEKVPEKIEGYDISNISGVDAVGSMVVFVNAKPSKELYRRFKIKFTSGPNDVAMIKEVISRRIKHTDDKFGNLPDLILIDGGECQLNAANEALAEDGVNIPIISLAKREELIYVYGKSEPIKLEAHSEVLKLFQSIRDEAHRFAKNYFTTLHRKGAIS